MEVVLGIVLFYVAVGVFCGQENHYRREDPVGEQGPIMTVILSFIIFAPMTYVAWYLLTQPW